MPLSPHYRPRRFALKLGKPMSEITDDEWKEFVELQHVETREGRTFEARALPLPPLSCEVDLAAAGGLGFTIASF